MKVIAVAGKGGTGKTTLAALMVLAFVDRGVRPILAVDADPNDNLGASLGIEVTKTLGAIREDFMDRRADIPPGMTKGALLEMRMHESVIEGEGVDLLVMGRSEGPGCYCFVNNLLRKAIGELSQNYAAVVIDNEAGMEHLSRRTVGKVDRLILVSDHTVKGVRTAGRLLDLAGEMRLEVASAGLVVNRVNGDAAAGLSPGVSGEIEASGLSLFSVLPEDGEVARAYEEDRPITGLSAESPIRRAVEQLVDEQILGDRR
jgi:CO dehydrogenase maturation factor